MTERTARYARLGFSMAWLTCLFLAARAVATAHDTHPEHLLGLLPIVYLAAWGPYFLLSRQRPGPAAGRFLLCTASLAVGLVVFESQGWLGVIDYRAVFSTPTPPWRRPGNRPDPDLLYVKEGPARTRLAFRGAEVSRLRGIPAGRVYRCDLELDRNGFRNAPEPRSADIVVIGDSFIEGLQVGREELITAQLSRLLGARVVNLGRTSYGPQQELHVLRRYGLGLAPRTCVWAFYEGNDLQDLNSYEAQVANLPRILSRDATRSRYDRGFVRNALGFALRNWIHPDPGLPGALHTGRLVDGSGQTHDLYFATGIQHGEGGPRLPRTEGTPEFLKLLAILGQARDLCARAGIDLVVAFVPSKFRVYRDVCRFSPGSPCPGWPVDDLARELATNLRRCWPDLGFIDLTPRFLASASNGSVLYLPDDTHWSPAGHRLAAEILHDGLRDRRPDGVSPARLAGASVQDRGTPTTQR